MRHTDSISSKAKKYYTKACNLNDRKGCRYLGIFYAKGLGVKKDYSKARKYFSKACSLNDGNGCYGLGRLYYDGKGVKQDYFKAKKYFRKACNLKGSSGCKLYIYLKNKGY